MKSVEIQFYVLAESFQPVEIFLDKPEKLLEHYLSLERLTCCDLQGGFFILVDDEFWSDESTVDEFWMTASWFYALKSLLDGETVAHLCPWEESYMTIKRQGSYLEMEDIHHSGKVVSPKITVDFYDFVNKMITEGKKIALLGDKLLTTINQRLANADWSLTDAKKERLVYIRGEFSVLKLTDTINELEQLFIKKTN